MWAMRAPIFLSVLLACAAAHAQTPPPPAAGAQPVVREAQAAGRTTQRVERVRIEDAGARVDELRYGGETQSITVQPKTDLPEYQVRSDGARVWNIFKF
jgi:hypothetical protein